jgi:hypothetical protein
MSDITSLRGMLYNNMPDQYKTDNMNNYLEENALELAEAAALNEATYYGKNKYLIQIEQIFQEMCDDYQSRNQMTDITSYCNDKRFTKVGKLFAKCFGFKDVVINAGAASILSTFCNSGILLKISALFSPSILNTIFSELIKSLWLELIDSISFFLSLIECLIK